MLKNSDLLTKLASARAFGLDLSKVPGAFVLDANAMIHARAVNRPWAYQAAHPCCYDPSTAEVVARSWAELEVALSAPGRSVCKCWGQVKMPGGYSDIKNALDTYHASWELCKLFDDVQSETGDLSPATAFRFVVALSRLDLDSSWVFHRKLSGAAMKVFANRLLEVVNGPFSHEDLELLLSCLTIEDAFEDWPLDAKIKCLEAGLAAPPVLAFAPKRPECCDFVAAAKEVKVDQIFDQNRLSSGFFHSLIKASKHLLTSGDALSFFLISRLVESASASVFLTPLPTLKAFEFSALVRCVPLDGFDPTPERLQTADVFYKDGNWPDESSLWAAACAI